MTVHTVTSTRAGSTELRIDELCGADGPTVALLGGIHGDEPEGVLAVRRLVGLLRGLPMAGRVRAVAIANPLAYAHGTRRSGVDDGDLARAFPGKRDGRPTAQIAAAITAQVLCGCALLIDLHSAGRVGAMPLFCGFLAGGDPDAAARSIAAARAFGAPLTWAHDAIGPGRTVSAAAELGVPALYVEAGGGGEVRGEELDAMVRGVLAVLRGLGVLAPPADGTFPSAAVPAPGSAAPEPLLVRGGSGDLDRSCSARAGGTLITRVRAGEIVRAGAVLAELVDPDGRPLEPIVSPHPGIVMFLRREAAVSAGDAVALVAPMPEAW
jgi:predicted deacylase